MIIYKNNHFGATCKIFGNSVLQYIDIFIAQRDNKLLWFKLKFMF